MEEAGVPFLGSGSNDAKSLVISVLRDGRELNALQIHREILEQHSADITYQGVHKAVKLLLDQGVLAKNGKGYAISNEWASKLHEFGDELMKTKSASSLKALLEMPPNSSATLSFDGYFVESFNTLLAATEKLICSQADDTPMISHSRHSWAMTVVSDAQYQQLKNIAAKTKHYILCGGNTLMDEFLLDFWKKQLNSEWRFDPSAAQKCDLVVANEFVVQIFHEPAFAKRWNDVYSGIKTKHDLELSNLYKLVFEQKTKTKLVVSRNEALADQIRVETLKHFKK
ncbi:MAG: hypothetical protein WC792_04920 [Candidatus Micrarchaeia archaeon]|jgi:hypothetical protein